MAVVPRRGSRSSSCYFVNAIATTLAILNVYARDLAHITAVVLQLMFFLTPIIYPITFVPLEWRGLPLRAIAVANPLTQFIETLRALLYGLAVPDSSQWLMMFGWTMAMLFVAEGGLPGVVGRTSASRCDDDRDPGGEPVEALLASERTTREASRSNSSGAARPRRTSSGPFADRLVRHRAWQRVRPGRPQWVREIDDPQGARRRLSPDEPGA